MHPGMILPVVVSSMTQHYDNRACLQLRTVRAQCSRRWRAPCTIRQRNSNVFNLSKLTFQPSIKEPRVSFKSQLKCLLNTTRLSMAQAHREHVGALALSMIHRRMPEREQRTPATGNISVWDWYAPSRKFTADELLSTLIKVFCIFEKVHTQLHS